MIRILNTYVAIVWAHVQTKEPYQSLNKNVNNKKQTIKTSILKKKFLKMKLFFRTYAIFEADNEIDSSKKGDKTTDVYKQNSVCNSWIMI